MNQPFSVRNHEKFNESAYLNKRAYIHYFNRLRLLATTLFEWKGLPDTIPKRFIEKSLFSYGQLAVFNDKEYGFMIAKCNDNGMLNIYDEPTAYQVYGNNGFQRVVKAKDCVIIRNNIDSIPTALLLDYFCSRLWDLDRTRDVNLMLQKIPGIIQCDEGQRLTLKNILKDYEGNEPIIYGNKKLDMSQLSSLDLKVPFIADKVTDIKHDLWKECLDFLGINNANTSKRERLVTDEVNSNNQLLAFESDTFLMCRKFACEEIKEMFDIDVTVELREGQHSNLCMEDGDLLE